MLPDFRFVIGAAAVTALLVMAGFGVFASTRLSQQAKMGPLETARSLAFTDHSEWNQFYDAGSVRRFIGLGRKAEAAQEAGVTPERRAEEPADATVATAVVPLEAPGAFGGIEPMPVPAATSASEENANVPSAPPAESTRALAIPAPPQAPSERAAVETASAATDNIEPTPVLTTGIETTGIKTGATETVASIAPALSEQPAANFPTSLEGAAAATEVAALAQGPDESADNSAATTSDITSSQPIRDTENKVARPDGEPKAAASHRAPTPAKSLNGNAPTSAQTAARSAARPASAATAKASAPVTHPHGVTAAARRTAAAPEADYERSARTATMSRSHAAAPRQRYATRPPGLQWNGIQRVDPRQFAGPQHGAPQFAPSPYGPAAQGQPFSAPQFGPQPSTAPQFGPHFFAAPQPLVQRSRAQRAQRPQYGPQPYAQPYDPRQFGPQPQPYAQRQRDARPSFNDPFGRR